MNKILTPCLLFIISAHANGLPPMPPGLTAIPSKPIINTITNAGTNVYLKWTSPELTNVVEIGAYPNGPWSAVNTLEGYEAIVGKIPNSNGFYRLVNQSGYTLSSQVLDGNVINYDKRPFTGNNNVSVVATYSSATFFNYVTFVTNGIKTVLENVGNNPCGYTCLQIDVENKTLYTLENSCFYGPGGPFTFREHNIDGEGGHFTSMTEVTNYVTDSSFGTAEDMLLLKSKGLVVVWKFDDGYHIQYRTPSKQWKPELLINSFPMGPSMCRLVQHNDGSIYWFIVRDAYWPIVVIRLHEAGGNLVLDWIDEGILNQEGEFSAMSGLPYQDKIFLARTMAPMFYFSTGTPNFRIGSCFGVCEIKNRTNYTESPVFPTAPSGMREQNFSEAISPHAISLKGDTLYVFVQEWNPVDRIFDLVYMYSFKNGQWLTRTFLYRTLAGGNFRGGAFSALTTYYNNDIFPNRNIFINTDSSGQLRMFEIE